MNKKNTVIYLTVGVIFSILIYISNPMQQFIIEQKIKNEVAQIEIPEYMTFIRNDDFGDAILGNKKDWGVQYNYTTKGVDRQNLYDRLAEDLRSQGYTVDKEDGWVLYAKNDKIWMRITTSSNTVVFAVRV